MSPSPAVGTEMLANECELLLESTGHGVLSLADGDRAYGVPMSYAYDGDNDRIVLAFVNAPDSRKRRFADASRRVTLTVYKYEDPDTWASVVATGSLHRLDSGSVADRFAPLFFSQADDAAGDRRWIDVDEVEREWYELRIDDLSGRRGDFIPQQ